ncbi:MAG: flagellar type III secretion system pore protein FliP [Myxococcota bacterium]|nr:flagellar biosynthetic protein FliP [Myxococcales bacterium]MEC7750732.1 flagellar type III secretion system pore protein FliP [Myxococcota bacterium]
MLRSLSTIITLLVPSLAWAQIDPSPAINLPELNLQLGGGDGNFVDALKVMGVLTVLSLAPAIVISVTSFTRIIIVFSFLRTALGTQGSPPNQVLVSLALFLTAAVMTPTVSQIWEKGVEPYQAKQINDTQLMGVTITEVRRFLLIHTRQKELITVFSMANYDRPASRNDVPIHLLIPAFMLSELKLAFQIGFLVALPFLVVDLVVATLLMSMGMMMLPPVMVSLPFKVLIFLLADGWNLIVSNLGRSFGMDV